MTEVLQVGQLLELKNNQTHHIATLWRITRQDKAGGHDGVGNYYYTDHNRQITYDHEPINPDFHTYLPAGALNASARDASAGLALDNFESVGILEADEITYTDLKVGRFDNAQIDETLIDWRFPWLGAIQIRRYWIQELQFTEHVWRAKIAGASSLLRQNFGEVYTRLCRYTLGDDRCQFDLPSVQNTGTISGVPVASTNRYIFPYVITAGPIVPDNNFFRFSSLEWTGGPNTGFLSEVAEQLDDTITLRLNTPFAMTVGDTFGVGPGCDKTVSTCHTRFGNILNHGGFPTIPGNDAMIKTPDANV